MSRSRKTVVPAALMSLVLTGIIYSQLAAGAVDREAIQSTSRVPANALLQQMVGTWTVQQRMWPGVRKPAVSLPPAVATRRMIEGVFLEETMTRVDNADTPPFTRTAYFNYDAVSKRYDYFSIDSRAPQMMNYEPAESKDPDGVVRLQGASLWRNSGEMPRTLRLPIASP
jgi:Protein of unknown function (DUF1579)